MTQLESNEGQSNFLFHLIGYALLLLALFDLVDILLPARFMNPVWEFQTVGAVVERVPLPLIGLVLIFYGEANFRARWELAILNFLSWIALVVGALFLLLIPLAISATLRINTANNYQVTTQSTQQMSQLQKVEEQVNKATPSDLEGLLARINAQASADIKNSQELKSRLLTEVDKAAKSVKTQAEATRNGKRLGLFKSSVKWNLGAMISGVLFIRIWQASHWARKYTKKKKGW